MLERALLSLVIALSVFALFVALRYVQRRRASRLTAAANLPTVLYFRSDHCAPCETQSHHLRQLQRELDGRLAVRVIDADREDDVAARYGIFTLPTTLITDGQGQVQHINYGLAASATLARQLESIL